MNDMKKRTFAVSTLVLAFVLGFVSIIALPQQAATEEYCAYDFFHCRASTQQCVCPGKGTGVVVVCWAGYDYNFADCGLLTMYCSACPPKNIGLPIPHQDPGNGPE